MSEIHFLDTNLILAMVLPEDNQFKISNIYFKHLCYRYISNTAIIEAKNKIKKLRRISLKISNYVKEYSLNNNINPLKLQKHMTNVQFLFLNQYGDESFPERLKKENFDLIFLVKIHMISVISLLVKTMMNLMKNYGLHFEKVK